VCGEREIIDPLGADFENQRNGGDVRALGISVFCGLGLCASISRSKRSKGQGSASPPAFYIVISFIAVSGNVDYSRTLGLSEDSDVASAGWVGRFGLGLGLGHKPWNNLL